MMIGNHFRFTVMGGDHLRYGHALLRSYRLEMTMTKDDLPPDE
jgi:hypothetical protein